MNESINSCSFAGDKFNVTLVCRSNRGARVRFISEEFCGYSCSASGRCQESFPTAQFPLSCPEQFLACGSACGRRRADQRLGMQAELQYFKGASAATMMPSPVRQRATTGSHSGFHVADSFGKSVYIVSCSFALEQKTVYLTLRGMPDACQTG
jgi:hypothetical protein